MLLKYGITNDMLLVFCILILTASLFIFTYLRVDLVAVIILVLIGSAKLLPPEQLFLGFSSEAVISLIAIMIMSAGLKNAGISNKVARWMLKIGKENPKKISLLLMGVSGILASFMRGIGTVALFLPIIGRINARTGISKSYLLMPVAFCAILGGTLTMVGTGPLILLNSMLKNAYKFVDYGSDIYFEPFALFDIFPVGLMLLSFGILYFVFVRKYLTDEIITRNLHDLSVKAHFKKTFNKGVEIFELIVYSNSPYINKTIVDLELGIDPSCSVLAVMQGKDIYFPPLRKFVIKQNAAIAIMGEKETVQKFAEQNDLVLLPRLNIFSDILHPVRSGLCEAVIPSSSPLIGREVNELHMRRNYKLQILSLLRGDKLYSGQELKEITIRSGDTLGMFSHWDALSKFQKQQDYVIVTSSFPREISFPKKMPHALFFFFLSILLVVLGILPISIGFLLGATGMIITGVLPVDKAYESVSWKIVFLLGGLLPLGLAMQTTGVTYWLSNIVLSSGHAISNILMQIFLTIATTIFALIISNIGATVLLIPVAFDLAINMGVDPKVYAIIVALSASNTFLIPTHGVSALIAGPGKYQTKKFLLYGGMMTLGYWIVMLVGVNIFF